MGSWRLLLNYRKVSTMEVLMSGTRRLASPQNAPTQHRKLWTSIERRITADILNLVKRPNYTAD
jgi:hypothetical protein